MAQTIPIRITGRADAPVLPLLLAGVSRAAGAVPDPFLPAAYLRATGTYDVGSAARSAEGVAAYEHPAAEDEVLVLELADGSTFITSAERLRDTLRQIHPDWLDEDGAIPFEKLRASGAAPGRGFGEAMGGLVSKVFTFVAGEKSDNIIDSALTWFKDKALSKAELGVTWVGTKALMAAIESRLLKEPGQLYRWVGASGKADDLEIPKSADLDKAAAEKLPMLIFVHGTGSSSLGSFGELRAGDRQVWAALERHFVGGIYAFEHRTLSESPIENALQLADALPKGACINLVSHSRGGLVADLLCLTDFDAQIDAFRRPRNMPGTGDSDPESDAAKAVVKQLDEAYSEHRDGLRKLAAVLRDKQFTVQRYVRTASPANGTKLAGGNFDLFLSVLLTLIGQVPFFFGSPYYAAFKRVVIEIAKNRTNPHLVPGIEAMLPDSPIARFLRDAPVRPGLKMAVIVGDIQGGNLLKRLGVLLTDFLFFDRDDNDLVVNTTAMLAGIAPRAGSRVRFDRGADVSHFRYFTNIGTRSALRDWLIAPDPAALDTFHGLPDPKDYAAALAAATRDALAADRPLVVVLPGVMGSHLRVGGKNRVWFDAVHIATGGLTKIAWGQAGVEADDLFEMFYGELCKALADSHRVERFPYDWRQPLDVLGERFGEFIDRLMKQTQQPIRLLAHSMGGLVVRACIHKRRSVMDALMARDGARLVMLGTPHQGAHSMVETLLGKSDTLRALVRLDVTHSMQDVLDIVAGFRGALQLLPKPGFKDMFQGQSEGGSLYDYQKAQTWLDYQAKVRDFWFGNGRVGKPAQQVLDEAAWLWRHDGLARPSLPPEYEKKCIYVFGVARNTPCGVRDENGRLKMIGTTHGDGTVSWESGRIGGIGQFFYMPAAHGDLSATKEHFPALVDLLNSGATNRLPTAPPAGRAVEQPQPVSYDAGPPTVDDPDMLGRSLLGGSSRNRVPPGRKRGLKVRIQATDLRFLAEPILVGHYEQDPIAGPQRLIDRELLDGDLSERHNLGLYPGPLGTAIAVLRAPNDAERRRSSLSGAVVTGLGPYDGALSLPNLTEAVRAGALRYLLHVVDVLGKADREVPLATLLLGYNSSANLTIEASVEALVRGVMEANARFCETTRLNVYIARLDIVELYIDTAISAVYALRHLAGRLAAYADQQQTQLVCSHELECGNGMRHRLSDNRSANYWPRLIVTAVSREKCETTAKPGDTPITALADRLRFLYVGQRARAESMLQQRQPGVIEGVVRQQIHDTVWNEDFGRMLFQLMVPHDFKDAARQLDQLVLVVDSMTANLPWELMLADDPARRDGDKLPFSLRMKMVRQLSSTRFRRRVRQSIERTALVIGNPSVKSFAAAFATAPAEPGAEPPDLPGAQAEAEAVARLLGQMGYDVRPVIGASASSVLAALYHRPWRILHVSGHGVFGLRHEDGGYRSGVLLSEGLLLTAAEFAAMEVVPDVVFLNCCHLGTVDVGRQGNKLAASVSRELIDIGVRCVVVAGWAVDDDCARQFGETFYEDLLLRGRPFSEAVFNARHAVYGFKSHDITWGAFQAYGDPAWRAEPRAEGGAGADDEPFVSPEELLDGLARLRVELSRRTDRMSDRDLRLQAEFLKAQLSRCRPEWLTTPFVQSAVGAVWYDLGSFGKAREALLSAVGTGEAGALVAIQDIERLANAEARLGETERDMAMIKRAISRLDGLDQIVAPDIGIDAVKNSEDAERCALRGSAYKRMASVAAGLLLEAVRRPGATSEDQLQEIQKAMRDALEQSAKAYAAAEGAPSSAGFKPYLALNRLALDATTQRNDRQRSIELARVCGQHAVLAFADRPNFWDAVMQPEALLVESLLSGTLGEAGEGGQTTLEAVSAAYSDALRNVTATPAQMDSVASQLEILSRFFDALSIGNVDGEKELATATRLLQLAHRLQPGRPTRVDRPPRPTAAPVPGRARARQPKQSAKDRKAVKRPRRRPPDS
jgi:hypothetical protein